MDPARESVLIDHLRQGSSLRRAAEAAGVSYVSVVRSRDGTFRARVAEARKEAVAMFARALIFM